MNYIAIKEHLETNDLIPCHYITVNTENDNGYSFDIVGKLYDIDKNIINWVVITIFGDEYIQMKESSDLDKSSLDYFVSFYKLTLL